MSQDPSDPAAEVPDETPAAAEPTGDDRVDAALAGLRGLADLPVEEHPGVYDRLHAELRAVLDHADPGVDTQGAAGEDPQAPDDEPA